MSSLRLRRLTVDRIFKAYGGSQDVLEKMAWVKVQKQRAHLTSKETAGLGPVQLRYIFRRMELANRETEPVEMYRDPHRSFD